MLVAKIEAKRSFQDDEELVMPMIGDVPMPARGVLAIGQAMWAIRDQDEFERIRSEIV